MTAQTDATSSRPTPLILTIQKNAVLTNSDDLPVYAAFGLYKPAGPGEWPRRCTSLGAFAPASRKRDRLRDRCGKTKSLRKELKK
jgi:hypothetical protein